MRKLLTKLIAGFALLAVSACIGGEKSGPEEIHWDRDVCELCKMLISDPKFAAEVRGGEKRKLYKFDDIGCAVNWLNDQPWAGDAETEIWVADVSSTREKMVWHNARDARYVKGRLSPMNYGYIATPAGEAPKNSIDFVALTSEILANAPNHICKTPDRHE